MYSLKHVCLTDFYFSMAFLFKNRTKCKVINSLWCCCALQASLFCCDWMMLRLNDLWESRVFSVSLELTHIAAERAKHIKKGLKLWLYVNKSQVCYLGHYAAMLFSYRASVVLWRTELVPLCSLRASLQSSLCVLCWAMAFCQLNKQRN